jgi:HPr kinase/phosphorylase
MNKPSIKKVPVKKSITVKELYEYTRKRLELKVINSEYSFERKITERELHRPGLAFSGFIEVFTYWRVQIIGNSEIGYLNTLSPKQRKKSIQTVLEFDLPCIIFTNNNFPPQEMIEIANEKGITLFSSPHQSTLITYQIGEYLDSVFAPTTSMHGSLIDVYGVGMLIIGEAAVGKSELTLDLIERGHELVADDVVQITQTGTNRLQGESNRILTHHMEIRGLGIIDIRRMFGIRAIRGKKDIDIVLSLEPMDKSRDYERIGVDENTIDILGVSVHLVEMPLLVGKNITVIAEAAALNHKLKEHGEHAAKEFNDRLIQSMLPKKDE